ncbi:ABC transporter substrate-binding protein [Brucella pituitosa]|uniref:ABC transporter substrate-binding protein n=1 Tax=Brucella pituitosa TaxID=571256 RepID=UPI000D00D49D|nr:hypothetical protein CQ062_20195 [Ochrobactrum sp. MYb68]
MKPDFSHRLVSIGRHFATLLVAGAAFCAAPSFASAQEPDLSGVTLNVGIFQEVQFLQIDLTNDFKNTPYKIEWVRLNGAGGTMQALGAGAIDLSWGLSDVSLPNASALDKVPWTSTNAPLKHIALLKPLDNAAYPSHVIVANAKTGIKDLKEVKGHTFAYQEGGNSAATALLGLQKVGLTAKDVEITRIPADSIPASVISGAVDVATVQWGQIQEALDKGTVKWLASADEVGFPGYTSITARTKSIEDAKKGAAIRDFLKRATAYSLWRRNHLDAIAQTYVKAQQLNPEQAKKAAAGAATVVLPLSADGEAVKVEAELIDRLYKAGFLSREVDYAPLVDARYTDVIKAGETAAAK